MICGRAYGLSRELTSPGVAIWSDATWPACVPCRRQGKRDGSIKDEPFAWEAREFLRKKCVGQVRDMRSGDTSWLGSRFTAPGLR